MNPFVERLEKVWERYHDVERRLSDPAVYSDHPQAAALQKERAGLEKIVATMQQYKRILQDIAASESILENSTDTELIYLAEEELPTLRLKQEQIEAHMKELLLPRDPDDSRNCIVEIRAGTGGDEAALFAADLYRMYFATPNATSGNWTWSISTTRDWAASRKSFFRSPEWTPTAR